METFYKNEEGKRYKKTTMNETGQSWWSYERNTGEFYVMSGRPTEPVTMIKRDCYVFDLDGTLFDNSPRHHLIPVDPSRTENWTTWNKACHLDKPIKHIIEIVKALGKTDADIRYITSRCEDVIVETMEQLMSNGLPIGYLQMRADGDNRSHVDVKLDAFEELSKTHNIIAAFEDQDDNFLALTLAGHRIIRV